MFAADAAKTTAAAPAVAPSFAMGDKIAVVDVQAVVSALPQYAEAKQRVQKQMAASRDKLQAEQKKLEDDFNKFKKDSAVMQEADKKKLQDQLTTERDQLLKDTQTLQGQAFAAENEATAKLIEQAQKATEKVAQQKGFTIVINKAAIVVADTAVDITSLVVASVKK
jgi:outer membrane protein